MIILTKENIKGILDELKERYGNIKIEEMNKKIWNDVSLQDIMIYHLLGKRIRIREKTDNFFKKHTIFGDKKI